MDTIAQLFEVHGHKEPWGLLAGIGAVGLGQAVVILYHLARRTGRVGPLPTIQGKQPKFETVKKDLQNHFGSPESVLMLVAYLSSAWFGYIPLPCGMHQLPASYFNWEAPFSCFNLGLQLLCVDFFMFISHRMEHRASAAFYGFSHKPHHKFVNPQLFNAFNGSVTDTFTMILVPLHITALLCRFVSLIDYIAFGVTYANYLMLIHSEYSHPWDPLLTCLGVGTPGDHHVHHAKFVRNYGHLFTYWDRVAGTYTSPQDAFKDRYLTFDTVTVTDTTTPPLVTAPVVGKEKGKGKEGEADGEATGLRSRSSTPPSA